MASPDERGNLSSSRKTKLTLLYLNWPSHASSNPSHLDASQSMQWPPEAPRSDADEDGNDEDCLLFEYPRRDTYENETRQSNGFEGHPTSNLSSQNTSIMVSEALPQSQTVTENSSP